MVGMTAKIKPHLPIILFIIILAIAAFIRFWAASISTGPDVSQFWAFAKVFKIHGLDFYRYADAQLDIFPEKGWGFFYPPVWLLILGLCFLISPSTSATGSLIDSSWRLAVKTPIIAADLAIGCLLFWAVPGSKWRKLLFSSLWLLHPTAWFESGVFGQFDAVAAALLLAAVIMLFKGKDILAFVLAALAVMTKQHTFFAVAMMLITGTRYMSKKRWLTNLTIMGGVAALLSIPFIVTGNFIPYLRSLFVPGSPPGYQDPLCLSFSGLGSLLTQLNHVFGWNTATLIGLLSYLLIAGFLVTAVFVYIRRVSLLQGMLAGFLVFVALYYRINYQYLVVYIPLAILLAAHTHYKAERIFALAVALLPAVWIWVTNIPWWFTDSGPGFEWVTPLLTRLGMPERYLNNWVYVSLALAIMCLSLAYVLLVFAKWSKPKTIPEGASFK